MRGQIYWPPENRPASNMVKFQHTCDPSWAVYDVVVMRFYATYVKAREAVPRFIDDSNYETEADAPPNAGRPRRRIRSAFLDSDTEAEDDEGLSVPAKRTKTSIPAPPIISAGVKGNQSTKPSAKPKHARKGQSVLTKAEELQKNREELMARLSAARKLKADKTRSPSKQSPLKMTSPWKVSNLQNDSNEDMPLTQPLSPYRSPLRRAGEPEDIPLQRTDKPEDQVGNEYDLSQISPWKSPYKSPHKSPFKSSNKSPLKSPPRASSSGVVQLPAEQSCSGALQLSADRSSGRLQLSADRSSGRLQSSAGPSTATLHSKPSGPGAGRRNLFPSGNEKTVEERLHALETVMSRVQVHILEVSSKSDLILMNVGRVLRNVNPSERRIQPPHNMPSLPLLARRNLNEFEEFLGNDSNLSAVCDVMANHIRTQVADPERKSAINILKHMISNNLAKDMNLDGGNNKIAFRSLNLYKVYQGTLQTAFRESDLSVADDALQRWLKDAKWRKQTAPVGA